jgi:hypothetical protein
MKLVLGYLGKLRTDFSYLMTDGIWINRPRFLRQLRVALLASLRDVMNDAVNFLDGKEVALGSRMSWLAAGLSPGGFLRFSRGSIGRVRGRGTVGVPRVLVEAILEVGNPFQRLLEGSPEPFDFCPECDTAGAIRLASQILHLSHINIIGWKGRLLYGTLGFSERDQPFSASGR